jgi:hypothetical protein
MTYLLIYNVPIIHGTGEPLIPLAAALPEENRIYSVGKNTHSVSGTEAIEINVNQAHYERRWLKQFKKCKKDCVRKACLHAG